MALLLKVFRVSLRKCIEVVHAVDRYLVFLTFPMEKTGLILVIQTRNNAKQVPRQMA